MGSLFSGGGGWEIGAMDIGIAPLWSIEFQQDIAAVLDMNVAEGLRQQAEDMNTPPLQHKTWVESVLDVDPRDLEPVDIMVCSPPCQAHSMARNRPGLALRLDADVGKAAIKYLNILRPKAVLIENVVAYRHHSSFHSVIKAATAMGYSSDGEGEYAAHVFNADSYGTPSSRKRMIARLVLGDGLPLLPSRVASKSWLEALSKPTPIRMKASQLAPWQAARIKRMKDRHVPMMYPVLVSGGNSNAESFDTGKTVLVSRNHNEPAWTVVAQKRAMCSTRVLYSNGDCYTVPPCGLARFQGFPDWYKLPTSDLLATKVIGNAVPPPMARAMISQFLPMLGVKQRTMRDLIDK